MKKNELIRRIMEDSIGKLNSIQTRELEDWKAKGPDNQAIAESIEEVWGLSKSYDSISFDSSNAFKKFESKISTNQRSTLSIKSNRFSYLKIAASLIVLVGCLAAFYWISDQSNMATFASKSGELRTIELIDESVVSLNSNTSIEAFTSYADKIRKINLDGEAFFSVKRIPTKPFIINTSNIKIEVLGTSFNVRSLKSEDFVEVYVESGKVKVNLKNGTESVLLIAGESAIYNKIKKTLRRSKEGGLNKLAWKENKLSFNKTKLSTVLRDLELFFNISIELKNKELENCQYTSLFNSPKKEVILETISAVFDMQLMQFGDSNYELSGGKCD